VDLSSPEVGREGEAPLSAAVSSSAAPSTAGVDAVRAPLITDPVYVKKEHYGVLDRQLLRMIRDPRDLPFVHFMLEATLLLLPAAALMYVLPFQPWLAPVYVVGNLWWFMDRFILILHCTSHRPLFTDRFRWLNHYIPWVLGPFMGETPETYYAHHIGMHHPENNLAGDLSSTMPYERDRLTDWLKYFARFMAFGIIELPIYHVRKRKPKMARMLLIGEASFYALTVALMFVNWKATLTVFVAPFLLARFLMMAGNWAQHAFIDGNDPSNPFKNSLTVINCRYNRRSFNDGYHIGHHRLATRHWTDMPVEFMRDLDKYRDNDAIIFEGIDFTMVWALLMLRRYDILANHFVDLRAIPRTRAEVILLLKSRTRPLSPVERVRRPRPAMAAAAISSVTAVPSAA
jgi:hypothetical protein